MRKLAMIFAGVVLAALGACGGHVVLDGNGSGGSVNAGGGGFGGSTSSHGPGGTSCFDPPDPASLSFCSGAVSGGGSGVQCENDFCDDQNIWSALCEATTCQCILNNKVICTCALDGPGNFCAGTPHCCPLPKK
jgi:hypothetical protein